MPRRGWPRGGGFVAIDTQFCTRCGRHGPRDEEQLCRDCAFVAKAKTLTIIAEPWALREVRRQHGISGETDRRSEEAKRRHEEEEPAAPLSFDDEGG